MEGLMELLPVGFKDGEEDIILSGWETIRIQDETKFVLKLADGRKTNPMKSNELLQELSAFEQAHKDILFKKKQWL